MKSISIAKIHREKMIDTDAKVAGWVRSVRKSKKFSFIVLNDGSSQDHLQIVVDSSLENYSELANLLTGAAIEAVGRLVESGGKGQAVEMQGKSISIVGPCDNTFPLQKKGASLEFLREMAHFRPRTNIFGAVFRIRHGLSMATHNFFHDRGYFYLNSPIITAVDGEGAGEMFRVTTLPLDNLPKNEKGEVDKKADYFGQETNLCVTGQLEAECFASGMGKVYTFGPTFRSENSNTPRHLAEFWMIEPELAFADLEDAADLAEDYIKYLIDHVLKNYQKEMEFLIKWPGNELDQAHLENLKMVRDNDFCRITYTDAIEILTAANQKFEYPPTWGQELQTEHERYLTEVHFNKPVTVTDYPADCKAFYMKQNDDGKTVRAMDVLVPGVGELIGGSQREESLEKITARMEQLGMEKEGYWWYLELRKFGTVPHAGFGMGFERAVMYLTGMKNIRDVIPFPRTPNNCDF